jgi:hypothetical protein
MAIRPVLIDEQSPFLGESCALCKEPFSSGQEIIVCPDDAARHHLPCWRANGDRCSAYGCTGSGRPILRRPAFADEVVEGTVVGVPGSVTRMDGGASKIRTLPAGSLSCAQSCLILAIAAAILIFAVSCFGLWAILDYLLIEVFDMPYREPLSQLGPTLTPFLIAAAPV